MSDFYTIETDARRRFLHIVMRGYWSQAIFDGFAVAYRETMQRMNAHGRLDIALVDGREFAVQARDISEQFGALIASCAPLLASRTATVVPTHLNKLQAERAGGDMAARYFTDMDKARRWLFDPDAGSLS